MLTWIAIHILNKRHNQRDDRICIESITVALDIIIFILIIFAIILFGWKGLLL